MFHCLKMQRSIKDIEPKGLGGILSNADFMKYLWISHNLESSFENCRITAMGQGAGAASVEYLVHSPMIRWRIFLILILSLLWSLGLFNSFKDLRWWQWQVIHVFWTLQFYQCFCCVVKLNKHLHCILWLCNKRIWMSAFKWVQLGINKDGKTPH